jgi:hypothetical protein
MKQYFLVIVFILCFSRGVYGGVDRLVDVLWFGPQVGMQHLKLGAFHKENFKFETIEESALAYGGYIGIKLLILAVALNIQRASFSSFSLTQVLGEANLIFPVAFLDFFFKGGFGYSYMDLRKDKGYKANGYIIKLGAGLDLYLHKRVSIGGSCDFDIHDYYSTGWNTGALGTSFLGRLIFHL